MKGKKPNIKIGSKGIAGNMKRDYGFYGHLGAPKKQSKIKTTANKEGA